MTSRTVAVAPFAVALAAVGCRGDGGSDEERVRDLFADLRSALEDGEVERVAIDGDRATVDRPRRESSSTAVQTKVIRLGGPWRFASDRDG